MKIAVWYNFPSGGAKRALHDHLAGLKARGHEIEIWRPPVKQSDYLDLRKLAVEHEVPYTFVEVDSPFYFQKLRLAWDRVDRLIDAMVEHSRICGEQISKGGFDVLFANTDELFHAPHVGRFVTTIPKVLYLQEPNRLYYEAQPRLPWLMPPPLTSKSPLKLFKQHFRRHLDNKNVRRLATEECDSALVYDQILVNSRFSRESVLRAYGVNAHVSYLGINPGLFVNRHLERKPFVMSVGSMSHSKNPKLLIEGIGQIDKSTRPQYFWAYNSAEQGYLEEVERFAAALGVDFRPIKLLPDDKLVEMLNQATAFIYAPRLEPFGLAPLEANACGTPVVAVAEGGVRETVVDGENGLLVDHDPEAIAEAVVKLLNDSGLAHRLGESGERIVRERWSVDAATLNVERHLLDAIQHRQNSSDTA